MKTWKIIGLIIGGLVVLIGGLAAIAFYATSGVTKVGDEFVAAVAEGDTRAAYGLLDADFAAGTNPAQVAQFIEYHGLDKATEASWAQRSFQNDVGLLEGEVATSDGDALPLRISLSHDGEAWKIYSLEALRPGSGRSLSQVPPKEDIDLLIVGATDAFLRSLLDPDLSRFHSAWVPNGITLEELERNFGPSRQYARELQAIRNNVPVYERPTSYTEEGFGGRRTLDVEGHFDTPVGRYEFDYGFVFQGFTWRLHNFNYSIGGEE